MTQPPKEMIKDQNDRFRSLDPAIPGRVFFTQGVQQLLAEKDAADVGDAPRGGGAAEQLMQAIKAFDTFGEDNDPHGEHDFGCLTFQTERLFWKIDLYDANFEFGSEEPANPEKTRRVLTIMLPQEY